MVKSTLNPHFQTVASSDSAGASFSRQVRSRFPSISRRDAEAGPELLAEATQHGSSEVGKLWQKYCCLHRSRSEEVPSVEL